MAPLTVHHAILPLPVINGSGCTPRGEAIGFDARKVRRPLVDEGKDT